MWAFAELHQRGLIYEGYRVLPYCWECETPLSNFETRQDDAYRERVDPAVTVGFDALGRPRTADPLIAGSPAMMVWTTTPWTLPSNLALAVGPEISYRVYEKDTKRFVIADSRAEEYEIELEGATWLGSVGRRRARWSPLHAALPLLLRYRKRLHGPFRRLRHDRGGNRHRAHGSRIRRG